MLFEIFYYKYKMDHKNNSSVFSLDGKQLVSQNNEVNQVINIILCVDSHNLGPTFWYDSYTLVICTPSQLFYQWSVPSQTNFHGYINLTYSVNAYQGSGIECQFTIESRRKKQAVIEWSQILNLELRWMTGAPFIGELTAVVVSLRLSNTKFFLSDRSITPLAVLDDWDLGGV